MLTGWIADIILDFLARSTFLWILGFRARRWAVVRPSNCKAAVISNGGWGCYKVVLSYRYDFAGQYYIGSLTKPFLSKESAQHYAQAFNGAGEVAIRVNPCRPGVTYFKDTEQASLQVRSAEC